MSDVTVPIGTWIVDPTHSAIEFSARHLMVGRVRGRFDEFAGTIEVGGDDTIASVSARVEIAAASVDTRNPKRDVDLRSPDFFDVERYPTVAFALDDRIELARLRAGDDGWELTTRGRLTVRDRTEDVVLSVVYGGAVVDHKSTDRIAFEAKAEINRRDWDLTWNVPLERGGVLLGDSIRITLEIEATRQP